MVSEQNTTEHGRTYMQPVTDKEMRALLKAQQGELDAVLMYNALADKARDPHDKETFRQLASEEGHHAVVFHELTGKALQPKKTKAILLPLLYSCLGRKILYPQIARFEHAVVRTYAPVAERFPTVESVKNDEKRHGDILLGLLHSDR